MSKPTDDELDEAYLSKFNIPFERGTGTTTSGAQRAHTAGLRALESRGYARGYYGCIEDLRAHEAARIVADRLGVSMSDVEDALALLADKMERGANG